MNARLALAPLALVLAAFGGWALNQRQGSMLDDRYHHLGNDTTKDWKEASPQPEGKRLDVSFDSKANAGEWTLFLEQRSIDNAWRVKLNGVEFALLKPFPELVARSYSIPAGAVKAGANVLSFVPDVPNDDVVIGKLRLVEQSLRQLYDTLVVSVSVSDDVSGELLPARVSFVDSSGAPAPLFYAESPHTAVRDGVIYVSNRAATIELPRGKYTSYATRGCEWSCSTVAIEVRSEAVNVIRHGLERELDTAGFIAADTHLHTLEFSGHGDASAQERQITLAGEGVEFAVATDHNHNIDYQPFQRAAGLSAYFTAVTGNEVTTEVGHFNAFPLDPSDGVPAHKLTDYAAIVGGIRALGAKVVVLNHPRWPSHEDSPFTNNQLDKDTGAFATGLALPVDAVEMINSTTSEADPMFVFADWFALLNRGVRIFAVGSSDSHTVGDPVGQGRTYFRSASDDPTRIDIAGACDAIKNGRTSIGMGIFATLVVDGTASMGDTLTLAASRDVSQVRSVRASLRVQAPSWIVPRKATVYLNGAAAAERDLPAAAGRRTDATLEFDLPLANNFDRWLVCVVSGEPAPAAFWPSVNPYTLAATNPVFIDVDGGGWRSPRASAADSLAPDPPAPEVLADVIRGADEAIAVHLLDLYAERLRREGVDAGELRRRIQDLAAHANPAHAAVSRFSARH